MGKKSKVRKQKKSNNNDNRNSKKKPEYNSTNGKSKNEGRRKPMCKHKFDRSDEDTRLRESIEADGSRTIIDMDSDGNCLFRSLSDQLYHDFGDNHVEIRSEICDYLDAHEEDFSVFLILDEEDKDDEDYAPDFESYVYNMRQDGDWGGNVELVAAARLYRRNIIVFSDSLAAFTIAHGSEKESSGPDMMLSYHDNGHYNSVRDGKSGKPPPPIKTYEKIEGNDLDGTTDDQEEPNQEITQKMLDFKAALGRPEDEDEEASGNTEEEDADTTEEDVKDKEPPPEKQETPDSDDDFIEVKAKPRGKRNKRASRLRKLHEDNTTGKGRKEKDVPEMDGDFRVLKI